MVSCSAGLRGEPPAWWLTSGSIEALLASWPRERACSVPLRVRDGVKRREVRRAEHVKPRGTEDGVARLVAEVGELLQLVCAGDRACAYGHVN